MIENSPFEDNVLLYSHKRTEYSPEFISYILKHGQLVKTFEYKGGTAAQIYEIKSIDKNVRDPIKEDIFSNIKLFGVWNKEQLRVIIKRIVSVDQATSIQNKCMYSS